MDWILPKLGRVLFYMELYEQLQLAHLLLQERKCRVCGVEKNLIDGYYKTRKNVRLASSYSYECKECTIKRVCKKHRKKDKGPILWDYPDW